MIITKCHIENFGKLSQYDVELNKGITCFSEENGWGKTTFAAFLKAMLFGLDYSQSKKQITDRVRYLPWNGGKFGGYMIFEHENKLYRIERYFGEKIKDDSVQIFDMSANNITDFFSGEIGDDIWHVNKDSYEKTAFISLDGAMSLHNDIIAGKLGDVQEQEADMSRATSALKLLEDVKKRIIPAKGKNGFVGQEQQKIAGYKDKLAAIKKAEAEITVATSGIDDKEARLKEINEEIKKLDKTLNNGVFIEKQKIYDDLLANKKGLEEEIAGKFSYLQNNIPSDEQIDEWDRDSVNILEWERVLLENSLTEQEHAVLGIQENIQMPTEADLDCYRDFIYQIVHVLPSSQEVLEKEIFNLRRRADSEFVDQVIDVELIEKGIEKYPHLLKRENELRGKIDDLQTEVIILSHLVFPKWKELVRDFSLIFGLFFLTVGGISTLPTAGANQGAMVFGVILLITSIMFVMQTVNFKNNLAKRASAAEIDASMKSANASLTELLKERKIYEDYAFEMTEKSGDVVALFLEMRGVLEMQSTIEEKRAAYEAGELRIQEMRGHLEANLARYFAPPYTETYEEDLHKIINVKNAYERLLNKANSMERASSELRVLKEKWDVNLQNYPQLLELSHHKAIDKIKLDTQLFNRLNNELNVCQCKIDEFVKSNDMGMLDGVLTSTSDDKVSVIQEEKDQLTLEKDSIIEKIGTVNKMIYDWQILADEKTDIISSISYSEEKIKMLNQEYDLLDKTQQLLNQANNNISAKYTESMSNAFEKYIKAVGDTCTEKYEINTKLDVSIIEQGQSYDSNRLSDGTQDMIEMCMRLALVDAVYDDVPAPLLVLDDPFSNLDDEKIKKMESLLQKVSEKNQLVYFSCHSSRAIKN